MIELIPTWFILVVCAATMLVNRAGASRVFFDVIGVFYGNRMLKDARAQFATLNSLALDGLSGIEDAASMFGAKMAALTDDVIPIANRIADARIEFEKFVETADDADKIAREVVQIGQGFGFTADQALMAAARMAQLSSVVGPDVIPAATQVGMEFGLIGGMGTEEAMTKLINLQQQTGFMLGEMTLEQFRAMDAEEQANIVRENSIATLDQLNTIENRSAATMQHMTFVMNQFASQADLANESIAGMAAQSATLIEAGEEQGKAGRALKQIYARLGADTSGAATEIEALGVATRDSNGDMRALTQIVNELAPAYQNLNGEQKTNLAIAVAGTHHYARFLKLMENNERTQELMIQSTLGLSPAMDEVNIRLQNQVTVLRDAEARLDKYKGTLGDALTPSVIMATEVQAEYNKQLTAVFAGTGGSVLNNLFGVAKVVQDTASGFYQNYVNMLQLNVAIATQKVLTASLRGEEMIREDFMSSKLRGRQRFNNLINTELEEQNQKSALAGMIARDLLIDTETRAMMERTVSNEQLNQMKNDLARQVSEQRRLENEQDIMQFERQKTREQLARLSLLVRENEVEQQITQEAAEQAQLAADDAAADLDVAMAGDKRKTVTKQLISDATTLLDSSIKDLQLAEQQLIILREQHEEMLEHEISLERLKADDSDRLELITLQLNALRERNKESAAEIGHLVANAEAERQRADAQSEMDDSKEIEKRGVAIGKEAVAAQQLAMSMMAAGSAMMMFSGATKDAEAREKRMRVAMILMNAAMIPQIFGMMKLTKQMGIGISVETIMERARHRIAVATGQATAANQAYSISLNSIVVGALSAEGAVSKLSGAFYRAIAPLAAFIAVGYGLTFLMEKLGFFGDTEQFAQTGTSSIQDTADAFKDNTKSITQLANEIVEYENEIDRISGLEGAQYEDRKQQLLDLISLNERLIGVVGSETADALGFEAAAEELFALQTELDDITGTFGKFNEETGRFAMIGGEGFMDSAGFALNRIVLGSTGAMGEAADEAAVLTQQINDLLASNEDFANFIESEGIDNIDEFVEALLQNDKALDNLQKTINGSEGSMGGFNSEIENSIQLFDEFNNAREELFFGFKAGNITGDLVKQIEQKGVENFVANTEIIMTNNFNGMTTDQVADEILRKINERAVTNGINVSPA
jgi:TP901 family phage tail tape measure protein